jgi:hypothetical protein
MKRLLYPFILYPLFVGCNSDEDIATSTNVESEITDSEIQEISTSKTLLNISDILEEYGSPRATLQSLSLFTTIFDLTQGGTDYCFDISIDEKMSVNGNSVTFLEDVTIGSTTIKSGATLYALIGDEVQYTVNGEIVSNGETVTLENYKFTEYYDFDWETDSNIVYSYPVSGNIYISSLNGYFSVDSSFSHAENPTILEYWNDSCYPVYISGIEQYVGKDGTVNWSVNSEDICYIEFEKSVIEDSCY